jgi:beta-phosphoglucomutase
MAIQGFIFDLDGVLTDTAEYHYQGWKRLADEEGIPFSRAQNDALRGVSRRASLELLLAGRVYPEDQLQELMARKNRYYQELLEQVTPTDLLPGVQPLLDELRAAGMKIALGSASKNARDVIARLQIGAAFDGVADGSSVVRPKPAPDLFVYAAGLLGLPVAACVVVEDATAGVEAAQTAGMLAVGLGSSERVGAANAVFASLDGVTLAALMERLETTTTGE